MYPEVGELIAGVDSRVSCGLIGCMPEGREIDCQERNGLSGVSGKWDGQASVPQVDYALESNQKKVAAINWRSAEWHSTPVVFGVHARVR